MAGLSADIVYGILLYIASLKFLLVKLPLFMSPSVGIPAALFMLSIKLSIESLGGISIIISLLSVPVSRSGLFFTGGVIEPGGNTLSFEF